MYVVRQIKGFSYIGSEIQSSCLIYEFWVFLLKYSFPAFYTPQTLLLMVEAHRLGDDLWPNRPLSGPAHRHCLYIGRQIGETLFFRKLGDVRHLDRRQRLQVTTDISYQTTGFEIRYRHDLRIRCTTSGELYALGRLSYQSPPCGRPPMFLT
jgi:hypothetical protein